MSLQENFLIRYQERMQDVALVQKFRAAKGIELLELHSSISPEAISRAGKAFWFYSDIQLEVTRLNAIEQIETIIEQVNLKL